MAGDILEVALRVDAVLDRLRIAYAVGGSVASAAYGVYRATHDTDMVIRLASGEERLLVRALSAWFYVSDTAAAEAVRSGKSFNAIHTQTGAKVDFFIPPDTPYVCEQFTRRRREQVLAEDPEATLWFLSPEDVVLTKLRWYRKGGETSEQQWRDVRGVLRVQAGNLNLDYLRRWAADTELGVADLVERALNNQ